MLSRTKDREIFDGVTRSKLRNNATNECETGESCDNPPDSHPIGISYYSSEEQEQAQFHRPEHTPKEGRHPKIDLHHHGIVRHNVRTEGGLPIDVVEEGIEVRYVGNVEADEGKVEPNSSEKSIVVGMEASLLREANEDADCRYERRHDNADNAKHL